MTETELAWFVGIFEGEGCLNLNKNHGRNRVRMIIAMTDKDVVYKIQSLAGGLFRGPFIDKRGGNRKPIWKWILATRDEVKSLVIRMLPHLGERRYAKALEVLVVLETYRGMKHAAS